MNAAVDPGLIDVVVSTSGGRVCSVVLTSSRPRRIGRVMLGRPLDEAGFLASRLFGLCGFSQSAAATLCVTAAKGQEPALTPGLALGLLAERVADLVRSTALGGIALGQTIDSAAAAALRAVMAAGREMIGGAGDLSRVDRLAAAARGIGVGPDGVPIRGSFLAALAHSLDRIDGAEASRPDALGADDDAVVAVALQDGCEEWLARPSLPGRVPETGCYARRWQEANRDGGAMAARFSARLLDIAGSLAAMAAILRGAAPPAGLAVSVAHGRGQGFSAVESPRGRLYHRVNDDGEGRILSYDILAPTEWNFHPAGPFVASLLGAYLGLGPTAAARVERLVGLFDPCVASRVTVREMAHA